MRRAICLVLLAVCSCQGSLNSSIVAFDEARYPDAARELRQAAKESFSQRERARFELYSGLTHLSLGNRRLAARHLTAARALLEEQPSLFTHEEQGRLFRAWLSLGRLPGQALRP